MRNRKGSFFYYGAAALTSILALFAVSCGSTSIAPEDTWCQKDITYEAGSGTTTTLTCYFLYSESGYSHSKLNSDIGDLGEGLTIAVVPASDTDSSLFPDNTYAVKTFGSGTNTIGDDGEEDSDGQSFTVSSNLWSVFYLANSAEFVENGTSTTPPYPLQSGKGYSALTDFSSFSWKKLAAQVLVDMLLDD